MEQGKKKNLIIALVVSAIVLFFVLWMIIASSSSKSGSTKPIDAAPSVSVKKTGSPTPVPTENCVDYINKTDLYQSCLQSQQPAKQVLNADVQVSSHYLVVTNNDNVKWTGCDYAIGMDISPNDFYEVGSGFGGTYATIQPHQTMSIPWGQLTKSDGTRFDYYTTQPNDLVIDCSVGGKDAEWKRY